MGWDEKKIQLIEFLLDLEAIYLDIFAHFTYSLILLVNRGKSFNENCSWWLQWKIKKIKIYVKQTIMFLDCFGWLVQILLSELRRSHFRCILAVCFFKWHKWRTYKYTYTRIDRDSSEIRCFCLMKMTHQNASKFVSFLEYEPTEFFH